MRLSWKFPVTATVTVFGWRTAAGGAATQARACALAAKCSTRRSPDSTVECHDSMTAVERSSGFRGAGRRCLDEAGHDIGMADQGGVGAVDGNCLRVGAL